MVNHDQLLGLFVKPRIRINIILLLGEVAPVRSVELPIESSAVHPVLTYGPQKVERNLLRKPQI
jgi:hypothetical protein